MAIYEITAQQIRGLNETTFDAAGLRERFDLQRLLSRHIETVVPEVLIIAEEFCEWEDSRRRIDLLGLDKGANLVVIELKRCDEGSHMELQAIRYGAMVSTVTFEKAVEVFAAHLSRTTQEGHARSIILEFLDWDEPDEERFAQDVRIVLVASGFSKELTTSVLWLNDHALDVRCVRMKPYADGDRTLIDVQQVIPLPEAADYMTRIKEKEVRERSARREQSELSVICKRFWTGLLERAAQKTNLHAGISPPNQQHLGRSAGNGASWVYAFGRSFPRVELYINGQSCDHAKAMFDRLSESRSDIENRFGKPLGWERLNERRACRIRADLESGTLYHEPDWQPLQDKMIETMIRFEAALRPFLSACK